MKWGIVLLFYFQIIPSCVDGIFSFCVELFYNLPLIFKALSKQLSSWYFPSSNQPPGIFSKEKLFLTMIVE
jgi:hypothetical protein